MKITINKSINKTLENDEINLNIEIANENVNITNFIKYINNYTNEKVIVSDEYQLRQIALKDIICFYSDKKYNYCRTNQSNFKIKSKLYEIEKMSNSFIRISKGCVINIEQVKTFDIGETGKLVVKFYDNTEEIVSRRKIRDVMNYLDERSI